MEQSIGVMSGIAIRNEICVRKNPRTEAANILSRSFHYTFSLAVIIDSSQNIAPAPIDRIVKIATGEIILLPVRSLHNMMLTPKMA